MGTYLVYEAGEAVGIGGFTAIYIATAILSITLGVIMYYALNKVCKNQLVAFFITLGVMYLLKNFIYRKVYRNQKEEIYCIPNNYTYNNC